MLLNPYDIPLVVAITNGVSTHDILIPAKGRTGIAVGFNLSRGDKAKYPKLVDTEDKPAVAAPVVQVAEKLPEPPQVIQVSDTGDNTADSENAAESADKNATTEKDTLRLSTRKKTS